jgi:hypothetical protein
MTITSKLVTVTFLAVTILFSACTKEKAAPAAPADDLAAQQAIGRSVLFYKKQKIKHPSLMVLFLHFLLTIK